MEHTVPSHVVILKHKILFTRTVQHDTPVSSNLRGKAGKVWMKNKQARIKQQYDLSGRVPDSQLIGQQNKQNNVLYVLNIRRGWGVFNSPSSVITQRAILACMIEHPFQSPYNSLADRLNAHPPLSWYLTNYFLCKAATQISKFKSCPRRASVEFYSNITPGSVLN